jgi:hypothetical protein
MSHAKIRPFLMFQGKAEEAMNFYVSLFPGAEVLDVVRYGSNGPGAVGSVMKATFRIGAETIMCTTAPCSTPFRLHRRSHFLSKVTPRTKFIGSTPCLPQTEPRRCQSATTVSVESSAGCMTGLAFPGN